MNTVSQMPYRMSASPRLARRAFGSAEKDCADVARNLSELHHLAPNLQSRQRFARRLLRRPGVLSAVATRTGLRVILRSTLNVTLRKDGSECFTEPRICWLRITATAGRGVIGFSSRCIQVSLHTLQRRIQRTLCPLVDPLKEMDEAITRALHWLARNEPLHDRDDAFLPGRAGAWAGGIDEMAPDPAWGAAFASDPAPLEVFSIRTFLAEEQMRPTLWLTWSCNRQSAPTLRAGLPIGDQAA